MRSFYAIPPIVILADSIIMADKGLTFTLFVTILYIGAGALKETAMRDR